jgi:ABC-type dipeptide/oligopeptide/nickel transport system ATPase component
LVLRLCAEPIQIADEPTTALDMQAQRSYLYVVSQREGTRRTAVTYHYGCDCENADRVVAKFYAGRIKRYRAGPIKQPTDHAIPHERRLMANPPVDQDVGVAAANDMLRPAFAGRQ